MKTPFLLLVIFTFGISCDMVQGVYPCEEEYSVLAEGDRITSTGAYSLTYVDDEDKKDEDIQDDQYSSPAPLKRSRSTECEPLQ